MKKTLLGCVLLVLVGSSVVAATGTLVRLEGWVVDSYCGAKNANAEGADCVLECHKKGAELVFVDKKGTSYSLKDQEAALKHVGQLVGIFATLDDSRNLTVGKYITKDKDDEDDAQPTGGSASSLRIQP